MGHIHSRVHKPRRELFGWLAALGLTLMLAATAQAVTLGAIGDSYTEEFAIKGTRNRHRNWVEQLATAKRVSFGNPSGSPTQYQYNYAFSGATTDEAISYQLPSVLNDLSNLDYVVINIGLNNFAGWVDDPTGGPSVPQTYRDIYNNNTTVTTNTINNVFGDIQLMVNSILAQDPHKKIVLANVPDWGATIGFRSNRVDTVFNIDFTGISNSSQRGRVTDAVTSLNSQLATYANGLGIPVVDNFSLLNLALQNPLYFPDFDGPGPTVNVTSNPSISGQGNGTYFWADALHAGTLYQGLFANAVLDAIDEAYGESVIPLLPRQIAAAYTGSTELGISDLQIIGDNWQQNGVGWAQGDFNRDGVVNLSDLQILGDNWDLYGADQAFGLDMSSYVILPEPTAATLLIGCLGLLARRRH